MLSPRRKFGGYNIIRTIPETALGCPRRGKRERRAIRANIKSDAPIRARREQKA